MWEYHVEMWSKYLPAKQLKNELNSFGKHGWELVAIQGDTTYIFKRLQPSRA